MTATFAHLIEMAAERAGIDGHALAGWFWMVAADPMVGLAIALVEARS
jgi:hypothetical protein